ncbi:MAG: hypothetical protein LBT45_02115 [Rickettsiales bacterium]|jgi:hypothetical protein|nr:hypothetical protein [Rickettsiales bacterium]
MEKVKTPFGKRQENIWRLEDLVFHLQEKNKTLEEENQKLKSDLSDFNRFWTQAKNEKDKWRESIAERLQENDEEFARNQGINVYADKYIALEVCLKFIAEKLFKRDEICKLTEIKSGFVSPNDGKTVVFFKGSTLDSIWNNEYYYHHETTFKMLKFEENYILPSKHLKCGEVLDDVQFMIQRFNNSCNCDHIFYDGAHYFVLYLENTNDICIENAMRSCLQEYGLNIKENRNLPYFDYRKINPEHNKMDAFIAKENERIAKVMGRDGVNAR